MKVQNTFYPDFISNNKLINNQTMRKLFIWCIYALNLREKMSQITHFCNVKFLAWKSGSVKFCDIDDNWYAMMITDLPDFSLAATTLRL